MNSIFNYVGNIFNMYAWDYITLGIVIFVISLTFLLLKHFLKHDKKVFQVIAVTAFFVYLAMVIYSSIINKDVDSSSFSVSLIPFSSYRKVLGGNSAFLRKTIMSSALYYPIGFLYCLIDTRKINYKKWPIITMSAALSLVIEILQYVFHLAYVQTDDVISSTIGCCVGILAYTLLDYMTFNERDY